MDSPPKKPKPGKHDHRDYCRRYYAQNKKRLLERAREYWIKNRKWLRERRRVHYEAHREELNAKQRARYDSAKQKGYYRRNRKRILKWAREYHARNRHVRDAYRARNAKKIRATNRRWARKNKERVRELQRRHRLKWRDCPAVRIRNNVRGQLHRWVKRGSAKPASTEVLLGCSFEDFRHYLERQFRTGMTWQNYGPAWRIDHIIPCSAFDLTKPKQVRQCFHFTNLRPLWAKANLRKWAKILDPQLKLLL